jgi:phage tail sheath gpL-like
MNALAMYWKGVPAMGSFTVVDLPKQGDTVEIVGTTFEFGQDVVTPPQKPTLTADYAQALAAAINAYNFEFGRYHRRTKPIKVWASAYGSVVTLIARVQGSAGNNYAYRSNTAAITAEGATLTGGADS